MDSITFTNKETNASINLDIKKDFIIIFGKNGAGKTTFSRSAPNKECVFNVDFIHKNVYIETSTGAKDDKDTKDSFSSLWIGEKLVELKNKSSSLKVLCKNTENAISSLISKVASVFSSKEIKMIDIGEITKSINSISFVKDETKDDETIIKEYKEKTILKTTINTDDELQKCLIQYKDESLVKILNERILECKLFDELFLKQECCEKDKIISQIKEFEKTLVELKEVNTAFKAKNKNKQKEWIREAVDLHQGIDNCLFCGGSNVAQAIKKWEKILQSKLNENKTLLIKYIDSILQSCEKILEDKKEYSKFAPNIIDSIDRICAFFNIAKKQISDDEKILGKYEFPEVVTDKIAVANSELLISIQNYLFKPFLKEFEIYKLLFKDYADKLEKKDNEIEIELEKNSDSIKKKINKYLKELDFDKELKIKIDNRGTDKKIGFSFANSNTKLATLSEGQKHKLAFAIFLASIEDKKLDDNIIVLDDPVVTLDYKAYHTIKKQIVGLRLNKKPKCLIVLTCNISFLYIQLSNLFENELIKEVQLMHLYSDGISEVDPNIINYDDLSLYKAGLKSISNAKEFCQIALLNIKIYRMFLDLFMRMQGIPSTSNPADEIQKITTIERKQELLELNGEIEKICKDKKSTNKDLFASFIKTNDFVKILGFPDILCAEDINKLQQFSNDDVRDDDCQSNSLLFVIVSRANRIMQSTNSQNYFIKNYLNHPRTQLTSSIVGIDFSDLEENQ